MTNGADVNIKDRAGQSPMTFAIQEGRFEVAQTMVIGNALICKEIELIFFLFNDMICLEQNSWIINRNVQLKTR